MRYQLVLQFRAESLSDFDELVSLEDRLISDLGSSADVDGHDFGSGTANIFILTSEPEMTFRKVHERLQEDGRLQPAIAAHRPVDGGNYTVIWPKDSKTAFTV